MVKLLNLSSMRSPAAAAAAALPPKSTLFFQQQTNLNFSLTHSRLTLCCCSPMNSASSISPLESSPEKEAVIAEHHQQEWRRTEVGSPPPQTLRPKFGTSDRASFLLAFLACTTSLAFTSLVIAAVPTLHAMGRAAVSLAKLLDTAREELPSTMAAIRLSGMEISDLTLELSDLSQEIAEGVNKSAQAIQAAEAGIRQIGSRARQQTMSMIEERANLPDLSIQPVVVGAAKKTSRAVGQATKTLMNMISRGEGSSDDENAKAIERLEI